MSICRPARPCLAAFLLCLAAFLTALAPDGHARPSPKQPKACVDAGGVELGPVLIGQEGAGEIQVWNDCLRDYAVSKVISDRPEVIARLPSSPRTVPAGNNTYIPIFFTPVDTSLVVATITLYTTDPHRRKIQVTVQGRGIRAPALTVSPTSLDLSMDPGAAERASLSITNSGDRRVEIMLDATGAPLPAPAGGWKVLFLASQFHTEYMNDPVHQLRSLDNVDTLEVWDGNLAVPSLDRLLEYDVVLVAGASHRPWKDATATGDALLAYARAGGKLCLLASSMSGENQKLLGDIQAYFPLHEGSQGQGGYSGALADHPITAGIGSFYSETAWNITTTPGAGAGIPLGAYQNGILIGAYHPTLPIVALNIGVFDLGGDIYRLLGNTFDYLGSQMAWMAPASSPTREILVVEPGQTRTLELDISTFRLPAGTYHGQLEMLHDGGSGPNPLVVPVALEVGSKRCLSADPDTLDLGSHWTGASLKGSLRLKNACNAPTRIHEITLPGGPFSVALETPVIVPAYSHVMVPVAYTPAAAGTDTGVLEIRSDAEDNAAEQAVLIGRGMARPRLTVIPANLDTTLAPGQVAGRIVTLRNDGDVSLNAYLSPVLKAPGMGPEAPAKYLSVLYLSTFQRDGGEDNFVWNLQNQPNVSSVTVVNAETRTLSAEELKAYGMVVVVGAAPWADAEAAGNALADYVDAGGKLCIMAMTPQGLLGGRILQPEYSPVPLTGGSGGSGYWNSHADQPILDGVDQLYSDFTMAVEDVHASGVAAGRYQSGMLLTAHHASRPVVFVNVLPWEGSYSGGMQMERLMGNVIHHLHGTLPWLAVSRFRIPLLPGETRDVDLGLGHALLTEPGVYHGYLRVGEDFSGGQTDFPVALTIRPPEENQEEAPRQAGLGGE